MSIVTKGYGGGNITTQGYAAGTRISVVDKVLRWCGAIREQLRPNIFEGKRDKARPEFCGGGSRPQISSRRK